MEDDGCTRVITFTAVGKPPVQQRPKITYKNKKKPVYYDPSNQEKKKMEIRT